MNNYHDWKIAYFEWKKVTIELHKWETRKVQELMQVKNNSQNIRVNLIVEDTNERMNVLLKDDRLIIINW